MMSDGSWLLSVCRSITEGAKVVSGVVEMDSMMMLTVRYIRGQGGHRIYILLGHRSPLHRRVSCFYGRGRLHASRCTMSGMRMR